MKIVVGSVEIDRLIMLVHLHRLVAAVEGIVGIDRTDPLVLDDDMVDVHDLAEHPRNIGELVVAEHRLVAWVVEVPEPVEVLATEDRQGDQPVLPRESVVEVEDPVRVGEELRHSLGDDIVVAAVDGDHVIRCEKDHIGSEGHDPV